MNEAQQPASTTTPTCYRHPDRATRLSCGRCGRPLCPDCMMHGPVGIRCAECLRPPKVETQLQAPERVKTAVGIATFEAALWIGVIATLGWVLQDPCPNLLLSGIAGGVVGWTLWRVCGRSHNRRTRLFALALGLAIPLLAAVVALAALGGTPNAQENLPLSALRVLIAMGLGGLFAWLLATLRHWDRDLF